LVSAVGVRAAQADGPDGKAAAVRLLDEGNAEFARRSYLAALERYEQAFRAFPSPKIFLNLAQTHQQLRHPGTAAEYFDRFLTEARGVKPEAAAAARRRLAALGPSVGQVRITALPEGGQVEIDGHPVPVERAHKRVYVDPGDHVLSIASVGRPPVTQRFVAEAGAELALAAPALRPAASPDQSPTDRAGPPAPQLSSSVLTAAAPGRTTRAPVYRRAPFVLGTVVTGVLLLGAAATGTGALIEHQRFVDPNHSVEGRTLAQSRGSALAWASDASLIGAAVAAVATATYALVVHVRERRR
jgi:hypothetical protein